MKALLVSEGKHELSDKNADTSALQELVRRLVPQIEFFDRRKVSDPQVRVNYTPGKFPNYGKRLTAWLRFADQQGYDALILVIDQDGDSGREEGVAFAQQSTAFNIPRAFGLAIRAFDAWMLADEQAISVAFENAVQRQPDPETIREPKRHFADLMLSHRCSTSQAIAYVSICRALNVDTLDKRCPKGFGTFHDRLQALSDNDVAPVTRG